VLSTMFRFAMRDHVILGHASFATTMKLDGRLNAEALESALDARRLRLEPQPWRLLCSGRLRARAIDSACNGVNGDPRSARPDGCAQCSSLPGPGSPRPHSTRHPAGGKITLRRPGIASAARTRTALPHVTAASAFSTTAMAAMEATTISGAVLHTVSSTTPANIRQASAGLVTEVVHNGW
jgi:hypothetical protein